MQPPGNNRQEKRRVLKEVFGFDEFRPGQEQAVDALLAGRNVLTVMPTGSGKSLCFQLPGGRIGHAPLLCGQFVACKRSQSLLRHIPRAPIYWFRRGNLGISADGSVRREVRLASRKRAASSTSLSLSVR